MIGSSRRNGARLFSLTALLGVVLIGCAGAPPSVAPPTSTGTGEPTPAASALDGPAFDDGDVHAYPDLEALIPAGVAGLAIETSSFAADPEDTAGDALFSAGLVELGRQASEVEMAIGGPAEDERELVIVAFRVPGLQGGQLAAMLEDGEIDGPVTPTTVAGRQALLLEEEGQESYAVATGEVLFLVAGEQELVEAAIAALP